MTDRPNREFLLECALRRMVNLSSHPLFVPQPDLPAWSEAVEQARDALAEPRS